MRSHYASHTHHLRMRDDRDVKTTCADPVKGEMKVKKKIECGESTSIRQFQKNNATFNNAAMPRDVWQPTPRFGDTG